MEPNQIYPVLSNLFRRVFKEPGLTIQDSTTSQDIAAWDSLNHLVLISAIEEEFKIKFRFKDLLAMENVGDLVRLIAGKTTSA